MTSVSQHSTQNKHHEIHQADDEEVFGGGESDEGEDTSGDELDGNPHLISCMGTNRKNEEYIKYMILFNPDGSEIRTTLKQSFDGDVKKLKTCLAELGFLNAIYESDNNQK